MFLWLDLATVTGSIVPKGKVAPVLSTDIDIDIFREPNCLFLLTMLLVLGMRLTVLKLSRYY